MKLLRDIINENRAAERAKIEELTKKLSRAMRDDVNAAGSEYAWQNRDVSDEVEAAYQELVQYAGEWHADDIAGDIINGRWIYQDVEK